MIHNEAVLLSRSHTSSSNCFFSYFKWNPRNIYNTKSPPTSVYSNTYSFAGSSTNKCKIKLVIAGLLKPSAILYASATNPNPLSTNTKDYMHKNPVDNAYLSYDLQNANIGKDQTVWITSLTPVTISIKVLSTSAVSHAFTVTITE